MDKLIMQLYAKRMSTRDINDVIKQIYGKNLSSQAITKITKEIEADLQILWEKNYQSGNEVFTQST